MPPAIEVNNNAGQTRLPMQHSGVCLVSTAANGVPQKYSSPYSSSENSAPSHGPIGHPGYSNEHVSGARGPFGGAQPAFNVTLNSALRDPVQQQTDFPPYQSSGPPTQSNKPAILPYQVQRSPQYQAQRSAQSALGTTSHTGRQSTIYPTDAPGQRVYHTPYVNPGIIPTSVSGHGHDFPQPPLQSQPHQRYHYEQHAPQNVRYSSPYHPGPPQNAVAAPYHPTSQGYTAPMQVDVPSYRHSQPSLSQHIPYSAESSVYPSSSPSPAPSSGPSKRGRPPGKGKTNNPSKLAVEIHSSPIAKKRGRPSQNAPATPFTSAVSEPAGSGLMKKRGRPFKSAEAATKARMKATGTYVPKKRGRPLKDRSQPDIPVPVAEYVPFLCEWRGCKAELHNLETLRRHVTVVHGKKNGDGVRACAWGKCGIKVEVIEEVEDDEEDSKALVRVTRNTVFTLKKDWTDHVEAEHLVPFSWHMGDGPNATSLDPTHPMIDTWLLDEEGNQVTPSVANQTIEAGIAQVNNLKRWKKEMRKLNLSMNAGEEATGSFMKTQAQLVQEREADIETGTGTGSGEAEGEGEMDVDISTGEDDKRNEQVVERRSEGLGEDSGTELMILDQL